MKPQHDFDLLCHLAPKPIWAQLRQGEVVVWVLLASLALRLILAALMPLGVDEAYAVVVSRSHALSYFDHPPLSFALARLMADIWGSENAFFMRLPFVLMGTASSIILYDLTRKLYGYSAGLWAVVAFNTAPFYLISAGLFIVPDGPLNLFLLVSAWAILPVILGHEVKHAHHRWIVAGLCLGLALLSKYQAVLFGVSALLAMIIHKEWRKHFTNPYLWAAFLLAFLGLLPVLIWNAQHDFISFSFQAGRAKDHANVVQHLTNFSGVIIGQMLYLTPWVWLWGMKAVVMGVKSGVEKSHGLLVVLALLPIAIFDVLGLIGQDSLPHWAMSGFLFTLPLVGKYCAELLATKPKLLKSLMAFAAVFSACLALVLGIQARTAFLTRFSFDQSPSFDLDWQGMDWTALASADLDKDSFVVAPNWVSAARMGVVLGKDYPIEIIADAHHFQFMEGARLKTLHGGYFIGAVKYGKKHDASIKAYMGLLEKDYVIVGYPRIMTQTRLGFKSFEIIIVPVERK